MGYPAASRRTSGQPSGEARPNEIYLDVEHIHLERVKSTIETLIKKQKQAEEGEQT